MTAHSTTAVALRCQKCGSLYDSGTSHSCGQTEEAAGAVSVAAAGAGASGEAPRDPLIDAVIGERYHVLKRLSAGGMGVVYKARHVLLDAEVAIKILLKPQDPDAEYRFLQEAQLASKIRHPNTVYISDFGLLPDGRSYIVMEFLRGPTLSEAILAGPIPALRACQIAVQITRGLQSVHDKGIVHRDLKPDNIFLIDQDGQKDFVKIVDFGIATNKKGPDLNIKLEGMDPNSPDASRALKERHTLPGTVLGTPHYMSPEQALGDDVDARADQYALGCILYEMLTGTVPFDDTNPMGLMFKHAYRPPPPLRERLPGLEISAALEAVVMRTLAKKREERFASMRDLEQALLAEIDQLGGKIDTSRSAVLALKDVGIEAAEPKRPATLTARLVQQIRRRPLVAGALALALLVGLSAGVMAYLSRRGTTASGGERTDPQKLLLLRGQAIAQLKKDAQSPDVELRRGAIAGLGSTYEPTIPTLLTELLDDKEQSVRVRASEALGQLGDKSVIPRLVKLLETSGDQPVVAVAAGSALDQLGDARGQKLLQKTLSGKNDPAKLAAALYLGGRGDREAQKVLSAAVQRGKVPEDGAIDILTRLAQAGDAGARDNLLTRLGSMQNRDQQLSLAAQLARIGEARGRDFLREQARRPGAQQLRAAALLASVEEPVDPETFRVLLTGQGVAEKARLLALQGLGYVGTAADLPRLQPLLSDGVEPRVRQAAAVAILRICDADPTLAAAQSLGWAEAAASGDSWLLRDQAVATLGDLKSRAGTAALAKLLQEKGADPALRRQAAQALARRRDSEAQRALRDHVEDPDEAVQLVARAGLLAQGDETQRAPLSAALRSPEEATRRQVVEAVERDRELLTTALEDKAPAIRGLAARKLAAQGDKRAVPVLREIMNDKPQSSDGLKAYAALRRLGEASTPPPSAADEAAASSDVEQRAAALEALAAQGIESARPALEKAARDPDRRVRLKVVQILDDAVEQPQAGAAPSAAQAAVQNAMQPLVRRLIRDPDLAVRARASALLSRLRPEASASPEDAPQSASKIAKDAAGQTPGTPPAASDAASAADPAKGKPAADAEPAASPPPVDGEKEDREPGGKQGLALVGKGVDSGAPAHVQAEALLRSGAEAFKRKDFPRAQKELEKLSRICSRESAKLCADLGFSLSYNLGRTYEAQGQLAEAMNEFARLEGQRGGGAAERAYVLDAVQRLQKKLGRVQVKRRKRGRCQTEIVWVTPGEQEIRLSATEKATVRVGANQQTSVGACQ